MARAHVPHVTARFHDFRHIAAVPLYGDNGGMRGEYWRTVAAFGTWLVVGLPELAALTAGQLPPAEALTWGAAFVAFGAAMTPCLLSPAVQRRRAVTAALLAVQSVAGVTMVAASGNGVASATLVIVAAEAASIYTAPVTWTWIAVQSVLLTIIWASFDRVVDAVTMGGSFAGFQVFAASTVALARREREAREELGRANAELVAARSLLEENSRVGERVRIARDLHDTLGHHLTALSLQLDVASRLASGDAARHVEEAHALAKLLLSDVRSVVSEMRDASVDLAAALRALTAVPGALQIHLDAPPSLAVDDAAQANALLRAVQEIITNAARHAAASHVWIRVTPTADGVELHARDDGRGAELVAWGNGLTGMRERFEEQGGGLEVSSAAGRGFEVRGVLPRPHAS